MGGEQALARLRERLKNRGLKLMLDFVPNHMGLDHPWIDDHPEYFIPGTEADLKGSPQNFTHLKTVRGEEVFAYGRDPYFPGWPDTIQLNYGNPATQDAIVGELINIARQCDGVRCDMAMLVLPDIFSAPGGGVRLLFGQRRPKRYEPNIRNSALWRKFIGTWNGRFNSRALITPTTNVFMTDCVKDTRQPSRTYFLAEIGYQNKLARFWKTTTNVVPPRPLNRLNIKPRRSSRF